MSNFMQKSGWPIKPLKNNAGVSLVSTLVSVGIVAIIGLAFSTLIKDLFATSQRVSNIAAAENAVRLATATIANPALCDRALKDAANLPIQFNPGPTTVNVQSIVIDDNANPVVQVVSTGMALTGQVSVQAIQFREVTAASRGTISAGGQNYSTFLGEIVIQFGSTQNVFGGGISERRIPICLAFNPALANRMAFCCENLQAQKLCEDIGGTYNLANKTCSGNPLQNFNCPDPGGAGPHPGACAGGVPANCSRMYYISGFAANMQPTCNCVVACYEGAGNVTGSISGTAIPSFASPGGGPAFGSSGN